MWKGGLENMGVPRRRSPDKVMIRLSQSGILLLEDQSTSIGLSLALRLRSRWLSRPAADSRPVSDFPRTLPLLSLTRRIMLYRASYLSFFSHSRRFCDWLFIQRSFGLSPILLTIHRVTLIRFRFLPLFSDLCVCEYGEFST